MRVSRLQFARRSIIAAVLCVSCLASSASAAPQSAEATGVLSLVEGAFLDQFAAGTPFSATFTYDTDEAVASSAITTPSVVPDHEFSSFYEFSGAPYGMSLDFPTVPDHLDVTFIGVVVNDNLPLTSDDTNGAVPDGTYDWIELLGSTTVDACLLPGGTCAPDEFTPVDGVEFTVALISDPSWFSDGSVIPDSLPASYTPVFVGIDYDEAGTEVGIMFATPTVTVSTGTAQVPLLSTPGLLALTLGLLAMVSVTLRRAKLESRPASE